eukprot:s567_g19.t1
MEVNLVQKGKGKKGGKNDKGKSKGKGGQFNKGKGKGFDSGKGKGHWQRDCLKKKADQNQQHQVRQVGEQNDAKTDTAHSTASYSTGAGSQAVRLLSVQTCGTHAGHFEDLTIHSLPTSPCSSPHSLRVLSELKRFDMSASDTDDAWTYSPDLRSHLRDVILDSGADTSALPLRFAAVGIEGPSPETSFVDAQGAPLTVQSTRLANIQFGDVIFRERFIVSDITCPLLSLGSVLRSGWSVVHIDGHPYLTKDDKRIEVLFKNNSLCARGQISVLSQVHVTDCQPAVRAVQLGMVLRCLTHGWNRINPHLFAIKTTGPNHVNTTLCPSDELMWFRTTLVFRQTGQWEVVEFCEAIADMQHNLEEEIYDPESIVEVITLAHRNAMQDEHLGFFMSDRSVGNPANNVQDDAASAGYSASIGEDPLPIDAPVDSAEGEPLDEDRVVEYTADDETVVVDGNTMSMSCTLKVLRAGCSALGLSSRGGKAKCLQRMVEHVRAQALLAAHGAEIRVKGETERIPVGQSRPEEPTMQEVENHSLTHEPYKSWCPLCVQYRAKQDPHPARTHEGSGHSVLSMDFGFCNRSDEEDEKLTCLFLHDRSTKMVAAIPTPQKAGKYLQYLTTEVVRFIMQTQHKEIGIKCDREPSILAVADAVRKTCKNFGIVTYDEAVPVGDHQANGAAEVTVQILRQKAGLWLQQIEDNVSGGKTLFSSLHPIYAWALIHAGWTQNRFVVNGGQTPYERANDRCYSGKLCMFGEDVLGYLRLDKGGPKWRHGIWLGKVASGDMHVIGTAEGIFLTRSVCRNAVPFNLNRFGDIEHYPWEFGLAAMGNKLIHNKRVSKPVALGIGAALPPQLDLEAVHVQNYARQHPDEDAEPPAEAGEILKPISEVSGDVAAPVEPMDADSAEHHGQKRHEDCADEEAHKRVRFADKGFSMLESTFLVDDSAASEQAPKTPKLDEELEKRLSQVTSTDLSLYEHEDEPVSVSFSTNELDELEEYEFNFDNDDSYDDQNISDDAIMQQLIFPFSKEEPNVDANELQRLDALADSIEIKRLSNLQVLTDPTGMPADSKILSTRFVRTWREKLDHDNKPIWLRRSRLVAREFAWLDAERNDLFSPASSSIVARLLPAMYLEMKQNADCVMVSIDVKDAFLTVKQTTPTIVNCVLADGETQACGLGRVLPGQRDGSLLWHRDVTDLMKKELGMSAHVPYPCILKSADNSCFVLIHVDDILVVGHRSFVMDKFVKCLKQKYEVSTQVMEKAGDEIHFLKRCMTLHHDSRLTIQTHHKHVQQMCSLLGLNQKLQSKKTPGHSDMDQIDTTGELSPSLAKTFRTRVGILLYLASDLPHCQHVVRHLATYSTQPTVKSMNVLKHLVSYLAAHEHVCISLKWRGRNAGLFHAYTIEVDEMILEVYTDSDWASDRTTRRSVSCAAIFAGGCLLFSSSRTQKLVSLSSAEAEVYSCSSGASDAILLSRLLAWMTGGKVTIWLHTDSSGARGILKRQGVGRVRHLSCRILWLQDLIGSGQVKLATVAGCVNPADVGTKRLPCGRLRSLMFLLGMFNVFSNSLEGSEDPGNILTKKQHLLSILSVLGLLGLKGCDMDDQQTSPTPSFSVMAFTLLLGFACILLWRWYQSGNQAQGLRDEPDAEPEAVSAMEVDALPTVDDVESLASGSVRSEQVQAPQQQRPQPPPLTAEHYVDWCLRRCTRRRDAATDHGRRRLYEERVAILMGLRAALLSDNEGLRVSARHTLANMSNISDDEESPNYRRVTAPTSLRDAQRAYDFMRALQSGASSSRAMSTNVDTYGSRLGRSHVDNVADALLRGEAYGGSDDDDSEDVETQSALHRRYLNSGMEEVSDPELWAVLHYGDEEDSQSEDEG